MQSLDPTMLDVLLFGFRRVREQLDATPETADGDAATKDHAAAALAVDALVGQLPNLLCELDATQTALVDLVLMHAATNRECPSLT
jgi:hypothetical protein